MNLDTPLIEARGLTRRYGGLVAVSDLTFEIWPGEILGLIGPNGAGKSTTFNLLSGHVRPSAGTLSFAGENIAGMAPYQVSRRGLVRTFQHDSFFREMTVVENLTVAAHRRYRSRKERVDCARRIAERVGLDRHLDAITSSLPHGLQRILSIAIAITPEPKLLGLDEPLTGLHAVEVERVLTLFRTLCREDGMTILLVDHNMKAMMGVCDRFVVLHYGKLLAQGSADEVRSNPDVIAAYLGRSE
ncbi:branched-chain amino acid transport system ATP-binding protein [Caballeronia udeis]|uniref:Branched-chain amino acid transport system ATP-binding protein n=1 Tax=Caballeronia udeis TaxID=1232866 RepID=A0ABW8MRI6_9BURK